MANRSPVAVTLEDAQRSQGQVVGYADNHDTTGGEEGSD